MSIQAGEIGHGRFTTGALRASQPADWRRAYRDLGRRLVADMDLEFIDDNPFIDATVMRLPDVGIIHSRASAIRTIRTSAMASGTDDRVLFMSLDGGASFSQFGRQETVAAGECILHSWADPFRIERRASRHIAIAFPRAVLAPMVANIDAALMTPMHGTNEAFRLLRGYLGLLAADPTTVVPELAGSIAAHIHDLVALAIGATRDASEIAKGRGLRAARVRAIKADVAKNLATGDVTSDALAERHRVSTRYIRKLFESEGLSLSQFVLGQRLLCVHRMLGDPRYAHLTVGAIAYDAGFGDLSTFNRAFRRHFGATPSDVRAAAREQRAHSEVLGPSLPADQLQR